MALSKLIWIAVLTAAAALGQTVLAPTPPLGWNSWDSYGTTVKEAEVKANADYMAIRLAKYGWQYIVIDIQWYEPNAKAHGYRKDAELVLDEYSRLMPAVNRFPSAAGGQGFKPLANFIHQKGLKFGIHIMRGIPRQAVRANTPVLGSTAHAADIGNQQSPCRWNTDMWGVDMTKPGAQEYYDSIVKLYADWGVDYIKADNMLDPYHADEIEALHKAIVKSGRPIVLSLSPGPADIQTAEHLARNANLWRISGDLWDRWRQLKGHFGLLAQWAPLAKPDAWPDADMLPLGRIGIRAEVGDDRMTQFTHDEQITLMTLWSIGRSPMMFGGDLPSNDDWTLKLLTNDEVMGVHRHATKSRELFHRGNQVAWTAEIAGKKEKYLAVFNIGDGADEEIKVNWAELGLSGKCKVRDLWAKKDVGDFRDGHSVMVKPHAACYFKITP